MKVRRNATRPHYRKSAEGEYILTWAITFITGAMLGAVLTLAWML